MANKHLLLIFSSICLHHVLVNANGPQPVYPGPNNGGGNIAPQDNIIEYDLSQAQPIEYTYTGYDGAGSHEVVEHQPPPPNHQPPPQAGPPPGFEHPPAVPIHANIGDNNNNNALANNNVHPNGEQWPLPAPEMPKISHLDVKCEKNLMKVAIEFDKPFNGIIFSKGYYSYANCVHLPANSNKNSVYFDISIANCGTNGNTQNGLYGYGQATGSGSFFENTIVIQYDHQVQEVWDQARKLRCTWHDQYEKSVTFRPFPVDMLDVVRADFAGDNVGCWMQIQVGKGPWASEVAGIVKIGQTMTMVLAIKDEDTKFDMLVRNCIAHDGKRAPIELVDGQGCIARPKLMSRFTKIKNFGSSATVLSYAHFQAFKFPDSMEVHFQCTIQICRGECPEQCATNPGLVDSVNRDGNLHVADTSFASNQFHAIGLAKPREERDVSAQYEEKVISGKLNLDAKEVGLNRIIQVVSTGDLAFSLPTNSTDGEEEADAVLMDGSFASLAATSRDIICMSSIGFAAGVVILISILVLSCLLSVFLCMRQRAQEKMKTVAGCGMSLPFSNYDVRTFSRKQMPPPVMK